MVLKYLLLLSLFVSYAAAQGVNGSIRGYVYSDQGDPVPDAYLRITGEKGAIITNGDGSFSIEQIEPGIYRIDISHISFFAVQIKDVIVQAGIVTRLDTVFLKPQIFNTGNVIVTASRIEQWTDKTPQQINIVDANTLQRRQAATTAEALREEIGLFVQKTGHGGGSANIRGFSSNQILLEVDGIRLNNSTYRLGNHRYLTTVDNLAASRIEIVRGPTSVLHGSDALGGTINIITDRPKLYLPTFGYSAAIFSRYSSADDEKTIRGNVEAGYNQIAFCAGFSYKDYSDLRRGENSPYEQLERSTNGPIQSPSGFNGYDFDTKMLIGLKPGQVLTAAYQETHQRDVPRYDKYENEDFYRWIYQPQIRRMAYIKYEYDTTASLINSARVTLSWQQQVEGREIQPQRTAPLTKEKDDVITFGLGMQLEKRVDGHVILIGGEVYRDRVKSSRFNIQAGNIAEKEMRARYPDDARYTSLGIFIQDDFYWREKWQFLAGLRYSGTYTKFDLGDDLQPTSTPELLDLNFQSLTASLGGLYTISSGLRLTMNIAQGFRAPNLSDLSKLGESKGSTYEVPNMNLVPEKVLGIDAGVTLEGNWGKSQISVFYTRVTDLIASADALYAGQPVIERDGVTYKVKSKQNTGQAYLSGFESSIQFKITRRYSTYLNVSTIMGRNTTLNEPFGGIPPLHGVLGVNWEEDKNYAEIFLRFARRQDQLSTDDRDDPRIPHGGTPGWWVVNARAGFYPGEKIFVQAGIENIFDLNYREHGSGINSPGRHFKLSLRLTL